MITHIGSAVVGGLLVAAWYTKDKTKSAWYLMGAAATAGLVLAHAFFKAENAADSSRNKLTKAIERSNDLMAAQVSTDRELMRLASELSQDNPFESLNGNRPWDG